MRGTTAILIVDDNPSMATTLVDILRIKGFEVYAANSGMEALAILRSQPVDILLTDVIMPEMNGLQLYREARNIYPKITTILMTAYAADEIIQQGLTEGIKTVLNKPLNIEFMVTLLSAFRRTLGTE